MSRRDVEKFRQAFLRDFDPRKSKSAAEQWPNIAAEMAEDLKGDTVGSLEDMLYQRKARELSAMDADMKKRLQEKLSHNLSAPSENAHETTLHLDTFNRKERDALQPILSEVYDYLWHVHNPGQSEEVIRQAQAEIKEKCKIAKIYSDSKFTLPFPHVQVQIAMSECLAAVPEASLAR